MPAVMRFALSIFMARLRDSGEGNVNGIDWGVVFDTKQAIIIPLWRKDRSNFPLRRP
jgi:hypothetical protein